MINRLKLLESLQGYKPRKAILEYNYKELTNMSDDRRKGRAKTIPAFYQNIDQGKDGHARTHWKVPSQSDSTVKYDCIVELHVPIIGGLFAIAKQKWNMKSFMDVFKKSDVKVYCSCPDFFWGGEKHNLGPHGVYKGALSPGNVGPYRHDQAIVSKTPDVRDPNHEHVLCKHLLAVMNVFPANASDIMSQARKFDNSRKTDDSLSKSQDDGKAVIKEEVQTYSVDSSDKAIIDETMDRSVEKLSVNNPETSGANEVIAEENVQPSTKSAISLINKENEIETNETELPNAVNQEVISEEIVKNEPKTAESLLNKPINPIEHNAESLINQKNQQNKSK